MVAVILGNSSDAGLCPTSVSVIEWGRNPSMDYYVLPKVHALGVPVERVDLSRGGLVLDWPRPGSLVVIVRYIDRRTAQRIETALPALAGVAYFMDDDLFDLAAISRVPLPYALRMAWLARRHRGWLRRIGARLWVSTPHLAAKYRDWNPVLLPPAPPPGLVARHSAARVFYHGTGLHRDEIRWLLPVVRAVQERSQNTFFEIFGRAAVMRLYRDIPRVMVAHPMPWETYRAYSASGHFDIGLAPLLPHAFNAARSHTKFYDFARCGAVGIYSNVEPYSSFVRNGRDGILVENSPEAWVEAILALAADPPRRERMAAAAIQRALNPNAPAP